MDLDFNNFKLLTFYELLFDVLFNLVGPGRDHKRLLFEV